MPYADPIKKKEYYDRHKKSYDKQWKLNNRNQWNVYQRDKARQRRLMYAIEYKRIKYKKIHNDLIGMEISDKEDLVFMSAAIVWYGLLESTVNKSLIQKVTGYRHNVIDFVFHNLYANEIIKESKWNLEGSDDDVGLFMEINLCAMAGAGEIVRVSPDGNSAEEKPISWNDLYKPPFEAKELIPFEDEKKDDELQETDVLEINEEVAEKNILVAETIISKETVEGDYEDEPDELVLYGNRLISKKTLGNRSTTSANKDF